MATSAWDRIRGGYESSAASIGGGESAFGNMETLGIGGGQYVAPPAQEQGDIAISGDRWIKPHLRERISAMGEGYEGPMQTYTDPGGNTVDVPMYMQRDQFDVGGVQVGGGQTPISASAVATGASNPGNPLSRSWNKAMEGGGLLDIWAGDPAGTTAAEWLGGGMPALGGGMGGGIATGAGLMALAGALNRENVQPPGVRGPAFGGNYRQLDAGTGNMKG